MSEDSTVFLIIYIITFLIGFPNALLALCSCIRKIHRKPIPIDIFMLNLALSDLVFLTFLPLKMKEAADNMVWNMPHILCGFMLNYHRNSPGNKRELINIPVKSYCEKREGSLSRNLKSYGVWSVLRKDILKESIDFIKTTNNIKNFTTDRQQCQKIRQCFSSFIITFLIGFPNAVLVFCSCIRKIHHKPIPIDIFMLNLALSDLIFLTFLPVKMKEAADNMIWNIPYILCHINAFMFFLPFYSSGLFLTAISAERYVCVAFPVKNRAVPLPSQHIHLGPKGVATGLISGAHLGYSTGTQLILSAVSMVAPNVLAQMG
ncbi:hypothetical protein QQF64_013351 [Cirrhinus molitorella]|uniref:G-protein coupled receptors family 1 profile domain-containing protein n=1 Tax=Cirrhinus molitorella TaxID=172907 RepID=A0ABR3LQX0_9TELE